MTPLWADVVTAVLVLGGSIAALVGSFGIVRLRDSFQRLHAPTLGATVGTWALALATVVQASFLRDQPFFHALLIPAFIALTAPISTLFLARAVLFRSRDRS
jgi:multicomponent K+:H+ antiporter subunit G